MTFSREQPYNGLPLLPPDGNTFETVAVYRKLAEARAALAELKGRAPVIRNPLMLINTLVLQEARDSSTIENIVTSSDQLFRAFSSSRTNIDTSTKEVLRYREAVWQAFNRLQQTKRLDTELIIQIFQTITQKEERIREIRVWIGNLFNTIYTPPEPGKRLHKKLNNWLDFAVKENGFDPLLKMAILHYQFEAIHPFSDGNGRTGRILNVLYLAYQNLLELPILYMSKYILEYKSEYYRLFTEVTENGNWEAWILYMFEAVRQTANFTLAKVNSIFDLFNEIADLVKKEAKEIYSYELIEVLFSQPYCKIGILVDKQIASRNTASKYLNRLHELGILEPKKEGKEMLFLNKRLYAILAQS